jgi:methionyl aminopeptidase
MLGALKRGLSHRYTKRLSRSYTTEEPRKVTYLGNVSPIRAIPSHIPRPSYVTNPDLPLTDRYGDMPKIPLITSDSLPKMRKSCQIARKVLNLAGSLVRPGITTEEIDAAVHQAIISENAYPSTVGYQGFPKACCTSINNIMCHGIPDDLRLFDGDIINIDVTVFFEGYHGDCSETFLVGNSVPQHIKRLVNVARNARDFAIAECGPGKPFNIIGHTISQLCRENGYACPPMLTGHGVGPIFHAQPYILHFENTETGTMQPGMTFTIEPIICEGTDLFEMGADNWTLFSKDGKWSAQFEHTILITETGHEILTL